jgi:hypothetical protein
MYVNELVTADPVELGSILFTLVEPHRGHEVAYNRWYERDHFYSGCMIGPFNFAGGRFVATKRHKALRYGAEADERGSYLALYWVLKGHHEEWNRWAYRQVKALHAAGRMFEERDHVHTRLYVYQGGDFRDPDGVTAELALDRRFPGVVALIGEGDEPAAVLKTAAMRLRFTPLPIAVDVPGVPKADEEQRWLHLYFCDRDPAGVWDEEFSGMPAVFASPFVATVPGTDTYTDEL